MVNLVHPFEDLNGFENRLGFNLMFFVNVLLDVLCFAIDGIGFGWFRRCFLVVMFVGFVVLLLSAL